MFRPVLLTLCYTLICTVTVALSACAPSFPSNPYPPQGWSTARGDGTNSGLATHNGPTQLQLRWTRTIPGNATAPAVLYSKNSLYMALHTVRGCNLWMLYTDNGRREFCERVTLPINDGPAISAVDVLGNGYFSANNALHSVSVDGHTRFIVPAQGNPVSIMFTRDTHVLYLTDQGNIHVIDRQNGDTQTAPISLVDRSDQQQQACARHITVCPVQFSAAFDYQADRLFLPVTQGDGNTQVLAFDYQSDSQFTQNWVYDLAGSLATAPVLSTDRKTLYLANNQQHFFALDTTNGEKRWDVTLPFVPSSLSLTQDEEIVASALANSSLAIVRRVLREHNTEFKPEIRTINMAADGPLYAVADPVFTSNLGYVLVSDQPGSNRQGGKSRILMLSKMVVNGKATSQQQLQEVDMCALPKHTSIAGYLSVGPKQELIASCSDGTIFLFTNP